MHCFLSHPFLHMDRIPSLSCACILLLCTPHLLHIERLPLLFIVPQLLVGKKAEVAVGRVQLRGGLVPVEESSQPPPESGDKGHIAVGADLYPALLIGFLSLHLGGTWGGRV